MSQLVFEAITFATECHSGHYRKGSLCPYIVHPLSMVRFLARLDAPETLQAAAALHDVVEDTEITDQDLRERFGDRVAELVGGVTEKDKSLAWRERKELAIHHAQNTQDAELLALKCADKLDNLRDIRDDIGVHGDVVWERFNTDQSEQSWYYSTMVRLLLDRLIETDYAPLAQELLDVYIDVFGPLD